MPTPNPTPPDMPGRHMPTPEPKPTPGVVLIGTGATLAALEAQLDPSDTVPVIGAIEVGGGPPTPSRIQRIPSVQALAALPVRPKAAIVSLPASLSLVRATVSQTLGELGIEERSMPTLADALAPSPDTRSWWRPAPPAIDPAALIGREPHRMDRSSVARILQGRRVLITGAGGSIGSEISRIVAGFEPSLLVCMERSENALFEIDRQLARTGVTRRAVLHDVVDTVGTRRLLSELRPEVVFHAAAHKHVPLMEDHPAHAVTNNVFGTHAVASAAAEHGASHFVLISTDKAVHPTSVMGATKRVAEQVVRQLHAGVREQGVMGDPTTFSVVRFGNVLGSACSVLPIWAAQLAEGAPLTITEPRMTRYFMTIPEAATLVIQAAALSAESDDMPDAPLYVLDMGEPIRIVDLAQRLIRCNGLEPVFESNGRRPAAGPGQAEVVFTGIRPGEKLHEELTYAAEPLRATRHPGIRAFDAVGDPLPDVGAILTKLDRARRDPDPGAALATLRGAVPEFEASKLRQAG